MSARDTAAPDSAAAPGVLLRAAEPQPHSERVVKELTYVVIGLPLGALYLLLLGCFALAALLGAIWIGLPLLLQAPGQSCGSCPPSFGRGADSSTAGLFAST